MEWRLPRRTAILTTLYLILILSILSVIQAKASDNVLPNGNGTLLVLGDSLSAGYGVDLTQAWVSLLQHRLKQSAYPIKVVNASVSGETSQGGLSRLPELLKLHNADIVILELGANDGLRGLPIDAMKANLQKMITLCLKANSRVLLLGMRLPPNYGPSYTKAFAATYSELAQQNNIAIVPFFLEGIADKRELVQADNLHPNQNAQALILDNVWPVLQSMLRK